MSKKVKNKDLAAKLGVSGTLVSLVLNNKADLHGIRKDTQEKVLALAKQMGYFNPADEKREIHPIEETPGIIGMIVPSLSDPFVAGITPYLQKAFSSLGMGFSILTRDADDQRFDRLTGAFRKFFSGLILVGDAADDSTVRILRTADYPFILLEKEIRGGRLNTVNTDSSAGSKLVAEHIKKLGYKNIIIVADKYAISEDTGLIDKLYDDLKSVSDANDPVIIELNSTVSESDLDFSKFEIFLRPPFRAEIVITLHSLLVYPVMSLLQKRKLRVPQDIALISMEEGTGFNLLYSPVTCLRKPLAGMAIKSANMIWTEIKNSGKGKYKRQVNLPPELVVRNSCGTI